LSEKLFCKVITAPATQSAAFTVFVVWDKDRMYYLTDKQMRDCIVICISPDKVIYGHRIYDFNHENNTQIFFSPCSAGIRENFAWFEGSYTSTACPADKSNFRILLV
jgi:hypothetical protein